MHPWFPATYELPYDGMASAASHPHGQHMAMRRGPCGHSGHRESVRLYETQRHIATVATAGMVCHRSGHADEAHAYDDGPTGD